jgi:hypothetical protein
MEDGEMSTIPTIQSSKFQKIGDINFQHLHGGEDSLGVSIDGLNSTGKFFQLLRCSFDGLDSSIHLLYLSSSHLSPLI